MTRKATLRSATRQRPERVQDRGDATSRKLLLAAIDVFGRLGFDGAATRVLADAAAVNLQAIPYYFGSKQGLYLAAAEHIAGEIAVRVAEPRSRAQARLAASDDGGAMPPNEARVLLGDILRALAELFAGDESEAWARFLIREQMAPTEAFRRVYRDLIQPLLDCAQRLVAILLAEPPGTEHVRLRTLSLIGGILMFRVAHAAAMTQLGWKKVGPREVAALRDLAGELVVALRPLGAQP